MTKEEYKEKLTWLKTIPKTWAVKPLCVVTKEKSVKGSNGELLSVYLDRGVIRASDGSLGTHAPSEEMENYQVIEPGDFILNNQQAWRGSVGVSFEHGIISPAYLVLRLSEDLDWRYSNYLFRARPVVDQFMLASQGVGSIQRQIHAPSFKNVLTIVPPIETQKSIAAFLDERTKAIDELVAKKEKLIELLREKRQSLITQVVTKGLDPKAKMNSSGIEWVGDIPKDWAVLPFRALFYEKNNQNKSGAVQNVLSLSYGRIVDRDVESNLGLLPASFDTYQIIEEGWIVFRLTDLQNDHKSLRTALSKKHGIITSAYLAVEAVKSIRPAYAAYLLHSYDIHKVFYSMGGGIRQSIGYVELKWMPIPLPSIKEQDTIINYLDIESGKTDKAASLIMMQIDQLKEYRSSLIYSAVTGKIKI